MESQSLDQHPTVATATRIEDTRFLPWLSIHEEIAVWRRRAGDKSLPPIQREWYKNVAQRIADAQWGEDW